MKWVNRGHEFDLVYENFKNKGLTHRNYAIFGFGKIGKFYSRALAELAVLKCFYDSHVQSETYDYPVISPDAYKGGEILILCASDNSINEMREYLKNRGFLEERDFWDYRSFFDTFFPVVMLYKHNKLYSDMIQLSITERCILKCKKCAHGCNNVPFDSKDISKDTLFLSVDNYFRKVDFVQYFLIIGGEPMIYKNIYDVVEYIGCNYRDRIGKLQITTNGLVVPSAEFLELCSRMNVNFRISNYINAIPNIKQRVEKTLEALASKSIEGVLVPEDQTWTDYGFDYVDRKGKNLIQVFDECHTQCHEIRGDKIYFCIMARSVNENMNRGVGEEDYLLLTEKMDDDTISKRIIFEFLSGFSEKGYLEMCNYCNGKERIKYKIPVAEQDS